MFANPVERHLNTKIVCHGPGVMAAEELRRFWAWLPEESRGQFVDVPAFSAGNFNQGRSVGLDYVVGGEVFDGWLFRPHLYALQEPRASHEQLDAAMPGMDALLLFVDARQMDQARAATKQSRSVLTSRGLRFGRTPLALVVRGCDPREHPDTDPAAVAEALGLSGRCYPLDADGIDGDPESTLPAVFLAVHLVLKAAKEQVEAGTLTHMPALD